MVTGKSSGLWTAWAVVLALGLADATRARPAWEEDWLARLNAERGRAGVSPLRPAPVLDQVAQRQAEDLAAGRRPSSAQTISNRLRGVGYSVHDWRESFLVSGSDPEIVALSREVSSPAALDGRYRDLGLGAAYADGETYYVLLFGWHEGDFFADATARLADRERVEAEILARVNAVRRRAGLAPLALNPLLDQVSQEHAEDMLERYYFGHYTPEGLGPSERARAEGYRAGIGENLVEQRFSAEEAMAAWLDSPPHRRNILDPDSTELGVGLAVGAGYEAAAGGFRVIWVQSFGRGATRSAGSSAAYSGR